VSLTSSLYSDIEDAGFGRAIFELQEDGAAVAVYLISCPLIFNECFVGTTFFRVRAASFLLSLFCGFSGGGAGCCLRETQTYAQEKQRDET